MGTKPRATLECLMPGGVSQRYGTGQDGPKSAFKTLRNLEMAPNLSIELVRFVCSSLAGTAGGDEPPPMLSIIFLNESSYHFGRFQKSCEYSFGTTTGM